MKFSHKPDTAKRLHTSMFEWAKQRHHKHLSSGNPLVKLGAAGLYISWNTVKKARRICLDRKARGVFMAKILHPRQIHQFSSLTAMDRYPHLFAACQDYFKGKPDIRILSYGCSTGEEVLTLRQYFPEAHIVGAEINKHSLNLCRKLPVDDKIKFVYSSSRKIRNHGKYDAIFCMAVLQRSPNAVASKGMTDLKKFYPFERFEQQIMELDQVLKPQGMMVLHFTPYALTDTMVAARYKPFGNHNQNDYISPLFDRYSKVRSNPSPQPVLFAKQASKY
ncbi:class I SAM-dependent methyltransferase [Paenibacillus sp. Z6-24]